MEVLSASGCARITTTRTSRRCNGNDLTNHKMELEVLDVGSACRLCLSVSSNQASIFQESETDALDPNSLPSRISDCVGFEVNQNDDLPSLICSHCLQEVDRWFVFRKQCQSTNELLNKVLSEGYQFISASTEEKDTDESVRTTDQLQIVLHDASSKLSIADNNSTFCLDSQEESSCASNELQSDNILIRNTAVISDKSEENESGNPEEGSDNVADNYEDHNESSGDDEQSEQTNDGVDIHWRLKSVSCPLCFKSFRKHSGVKLHLRIVHTILKVFPCLICAHVSCSSTDRKNHITKKHPVDTLKKNTCTLCGISVKNNSSFQRHLRKHESDQQCEICSIQLDSIEALQKHKRTEHKEEQDDPPSGVEPSFKCHLCENVSFWKETDWRAHYLETHKTEEIFPCLVCDRAFRTKALLATHVRSHTGEKPYMCEQCATRFSSKDSLRNHMRKHTSKFQCKECNRTYTSNAGLLYHRRTHTGETPYVCHECGKTFKSLTGMQFHLRIHTGEKPYSCDVCGFVCRNYSGLYAHKVIHSDERPFECDECGKTFKLNAWLKEHKKTHTGEKNYVCEICSYSFIANYQLKSHMKTHSGERPHRCEYCHKAFARRDTLTEHLRIHTKEARYSCQTCQKDFMFLKPFKKHKCISGTSGTFGSESNHEISSASEDNE